MKIKYKPTGKIYENRKDAKEDLGHSVFNKALKDGKIDFITIYEPSDVII